MTNERHLMPVKLRREKVKEYVAMRLKTNEIANILNCSPRTVERDVMNIRNDWAKDVKEKKYEQVLIDFSTNNDMIVRRSWDMFMDSSSSKNEKIRLLKVISEATENNLKIMQTLGMVPKVAEKHEVSGDLTIAELRRALE